MDDNRHNQGLIDENETPEQAAIRELKVSHVYSK
jgi:hypothetical protein